MFGWSDSFAVGIPQIDAQHKQLFEIISDLHEAMKNRRSSLIMEQTLNKLVDYTVKHFGTEEALLRTRNYSELLQHKVIHEQFTARIKKFQEQHQAGAALINIELMEMLQKWLVGQIQGTDMKYVRELSGAM